jgi:hypothetical protein
MKASINYKVSRNFYRKAAGGTVDGAPAAIYEKLKYA